MTSPARPAPSLPTRAAAPLDVRSLALMGVAASLALYCFFYLPRGAWDYNFGYFYGRDFINFWAAGRLTLTGQSALLFNEAAYNGWLQAQFAANIGPHHIYSYPPTLILFLLPFGALPYAIALALWTLFNLAAVAIAARTIMTSFAADPGAWAADNRARAVMLALAAPATALAAFQGHMTGALAALLLGALVLLERRPLVAGVLLGLLTVKPHLGLVVGLIVFFERRWTTLLATAATGGALVVISLVLSGPGAWVGYVSETIATQNRMLAEMNVGFRFFLITPYATLRATGLSDRIALAAHAVIAVLVVTLALRCWRADGPSQRGLAVVALASVLAPPYANLYDLTVVALALLPALLAARLAPLLAYALWLVPALGLPVAMFSAPWAALLLVPAVIIMAWPRASARARDVALV